MEARPRSQRAANLREHRLRRGVESDDRVSTRCSAPREPAIHCPATIGGESSRPELANSCHSERLASSTSRSASCHSSRRRDKPPAGEIWVCGAGNLLFLGGKGNSGSPGAYGKSCTTDNSWLRSEGRQCEKG